MLRFCSIICDHFLLGLLEHLHLLRPPSFVAANHSPANLSAYFMPGRNPKFLLSNSTHVNIVNALPYQVPTHLPSAINTPHKYPLLSTLTRIYDFFFLSLAFSVSFFLHRFSFPTLSLSLSGFLCVLEDIAFLSFLFTTTLNPLS
jgi:hypothetical protein